MKNARTWIAENGVVIAGPEEAARALAGAASAAGSRSAWRARAASSPGPSAEFGLNVRGGSVSKRASSTTTATVTIRAASAFNNANRSVTMWRRETPERPRLARVASTIAGGPQT